MNDEEKEKSPDEAISELLSLLKPSNIIEAGSTLQTAAIESILTKLSNISISFIGSYLREYAKFLKNLKENNIPTDDEFLNDVYNGLKDPRLITDEEYRDNLMNRLYDKQSQAMNKENVPKIGVYDRNRYQTGGIGEISEEEKYMYTKKPIWFNKKDMIWN